MMHPEFKNRNVIVTGAGRGIGRAVAKKLDLAGANVIAISKSQENLDSLKQDCPNMTTIQCDLKFWPETKRKLKHYGRHIDFLVNNAGVLDSIPIGEIEEKVVDDLFSVNYKASLNILQIVSEGMKRRKFGSIVNVSSVSGISALDGHAVYGSTKSALDMLTKIAAKELGPFNVRVNSVNPTVVETDMAEKFWSSEALKEEMKSKIPMKRFATVQEVVDPILFLLSPYANMINGVLLPIDGGFTAN